jgi:hypothetical protein
LTRINGATRASCTLQAEWQWRQLPTPDGVPASRDMAALVLLDDTRLLLFGGRSEGGKALQDTWQCDLST